MIASGDGICQQDRSQKWHWRLGAAPHHLSFSTTANNSLQDGKCLHSVPSAKNVVGISSDSLAHGSESLARYSRRDWKDCKLVKKKSRLTWQPKHSEVSFERWLKTSGKSCHWIQVKAASEESLAAPRSCRSIAMHHIAEAPPTTSRISWVIAA